MNKEKYVLKKYLELSNSQLANELDCTVNLIESILRKLKIKRPVELSRKMQGRKQKGDLNANWKGGITSATFNKRDRERYPHKNKARVILRKAVKEGDIFKPNYCSKCGVQKEKKEIHGHHEDYTKPLEVIWVCAWCHNKIHNT